MDTKATKIYDIAHILYDAALPTRYYAQHAFRSYMNLKLIITGILSKFNLSTKEIAFINLPSIFKGKSLITSLSSYVENKESPFICSNYKKPIHSTIFNFNKLVTELDIETTTCTPDS